MGAGAGNRSYYNIRLIGTRLGTASNPGGCADMGYRRCSLPHDCSLSVANCHGGGGYYYISLVVVDSLRANSMISL